MRRIRYMHNATYKVDSTIHARPATEKKNQKLRVVDLMASNDRKKTTEEYK